MSKIQTRNRLLMQGKEQLARLKGSFLSIYSTKLTASLYRDCSRDSRIGLRIGLKYRIT
jgi:hypothetical protein